MKQNIGNFSKVMLVVVASVMLAACSSIGGFNEWLGITSDGIDTNNVAQNKPLQTVSSNNLPTPEGVTAIDSVQTAVITTNAPKIVAPRIIAPKSSIVKVTRPKVAPPKITKPVVKVTTPTVKVTPIVTKPDVKTAKVTTPTVKPVVVAAKPTKFSPATYKFVDLFTFRSDMRAGRLINALATAKRVAVAQPKLCKLEGLKFTCGEYFIMIK